MSSKRQTLLDTLKDLFALYDLKQKGSIETQDALTLLSSLGFTCDDYEVFLDQLQPESIDFPTFYHIAKETMKKFEEKSLIAAFQHFDVQGTGKLNKSDFKSILECDFDILHPQEVKMILDQVPEDGIDYSGLIKMIIATSGQ